MNTPIYDFVRGYADSDAARFHMPGHKGIPALGPEPLDVTEIPGADVLYHAEGIIRESEENAARLFGSQRTVYSVEGSSLCIRAMLYLGMQYAKRQGREALVLAARNAHSTFLTAAGLLDLEVRWLYGEGLLTCELSPETLDAELTASGACLVYITSPDYLGHVADVQALSEVCHRHGALILVDNAHGAYLRFLSESRHPMDLGADLCCDSAHKTLPVLTGGAYLHFGKTCPRELVDAAHRAMGLFASTSPSYLILQSLDLANQALSEEWPQRLCKTADRLDQLKSQLLADGWTLFGDEPVKLTLCPKNRGYSGEEIAAVLQQQNLWCEFADPDFIVFMVSPDTPEGDFERLQSALSEIPAKAAITETPPPLPRPERGMTIRQALLSACETLPLDRCIGRILAAPTVSCPPAVPILTCGERIDENALKLLRYYGAETCDVVCQEKILDSDCK